MSAVAPDPPSPSAVEELSLQLQQIPRHTGTVIMDHRGTILAVSTKWNEEEQRHLQFLH